MVSYLKWWFSWPVYCPISHEASVLVSHFKKKNFHLSEEDGDKTSILGFWEKHLWQMYSWKWRKCILVMWHCFSSKSWSDQLPKLNIVPYLFLVSCEYIKFQTHLKRVNFHLQCRKDNEKSAANFRLLTVSFDFWNMLSLPSLAFIPLWCSCWYLIYYKPRCYSVGKLLNCCFSERLVGSVNSEVVSIALPNSQENDQKMVDG